ncbi:7259_t:CDS:1, partial [Gigaspora rosea]
ITYDAESESIRFVFTTAITPRYGSSSYSPTNDRKKFILVLKCLILTRLITI